MIASSTPPPLKETSTAPTGARHVIAVGGGRGGVGKSLLSVNIAVYLAQLGRSVLLVDADSAGPSLHTLLGVEAPMAPAPAEDAEEDTLATVPTPVPGLRLVPQSYRVGSTQPERAGRKAHWVHELRKLDVDYIVLDLGAGTAPQTLDLFLSADLGVTVTTPEPPSVEAVYRFVRGLFQRTVRRLLVSDRFRMRLFERALSELGPLPAPQDLVRALARYDSSLGKLAAAELSRLRPRLVVNETRLRTDIELGPTMREMARRYLGAEIDYLGHVEHDDAAWLSVLRRRPLLIDNTTSKGARNIERLSRRLLALMVTREGERVAEPIHLTPPEPNLYDVLGVPRGATDEELRRAYKRQRENYQSGSLPLTSLLASDALKAEQAQIEEAHETLLDPLRRKAYDASLFPDEPMDSPRPVPVDPTLEAERELMQRELLREINAETEFTGRLLAKVRESKGTTIEEIARATKISMTHLRAIEADAFPDLPALVYTRGFVQELAKYLKLDAAQVVKTYVRRYREWLSAAGGGEATS
ncbi:MAG TPA: helix-turn-helix domain-containing protein [Polyangiaceae bacterium]|jgi:flagellar biosynthesis protein FlhG|nr:helix-turn-helix domain-containing protein [Polyangiaceae bacterium]